MNRFNRLVGALVAATLALVGSMSPAFAASPGVSAGLQVQASGRYYGAQGVILPIIPFDISSLLTLTPGTTAGKADKLYVAQRTIAASSSENLDLVGVLTDPLGASLTFVKVKAILVIASSANTNNLVVGATGTNAFVGPFVDATDGLSIPPGGAVMITHPGAGWSVTATTADLLKVANGGAGTGVTYKIIIIGTSA
jgi:hypothetical protein